MSTDAARDLSPLKRAYLALERMQARCRELEQARSEAIAVVGMACRLPGGADHPEAYWHLLRSGVDAVSDVPPGRWDVDALYDPDPAAPGKMCTRRGGFLRERIDEFDPQFFGISPREAETMDPQQRLLLEVGWEALENAAQVEERLAGSSTGVFVGMTSHDFSDFYLAGQGLHRLGMHIITGNTHNAAAGRLSYCFGFQGPCLAVDTACSSSLVAVHLAYQSLLRNECRRALAGGVNLILSPVATIALSQVLAADGLCRAFDAAASGMVRGEGCAVVVLKRLSHALEDGDNILALIRGTAVNHDGPSSGLTVPNGPAQEALIRQALASAGLKPGDIDYVEAHGTGTPLGDPVELRALAGVFGTDRDRALVVGSVKTNIGHLEACAGVASLLKVVLALTNQEIPPHLHFREPTPHLPWDELPLVVPTETRPWPAGSRPRLAGVSSFGLSGVNAHVVLQEAPAAAPEETGRHRPLHLFTLSGRSEQALRQSAERFATHLGRHPDLALGDVCFSAGAGRAHASHRLGLVAGSLSEARDHLAAFAGGRPLPGLEQRCSETPPKVAFLFTGQGSQYAGMGRELYETQPAFRRSLQRCDEILRPHLPRSLLDVLFATPAEPSPLDETAYAQPALFALEYALAEVWRSWGMQPAVVLGHSVGEYAAACVAGLFSMETGLTLIAERARLIQELPRDGAMAAIFAAPAEVETAIRPHAADVAVAAYNGPENVVISGRKEAVSAVLSKFAAAGVKTRGLRVSHAFHSPLMDPILDAFEAKVRAVSFTTPRIGLVSNLYGGPAAPDVASAGYWRRHLRQPVRFADGVKAAREKGCTVFLELGPKPTLLGLARASLEGEDLAWLASLRPGQPDWRPMLESLAALYVRGARIDWPGFEQGCRRRRVALPTTPFQRHRCWPETPAGRTDGAALGGPGQGRLHPLLGGRLALAGTSDLRFESRIGRDAPVYLQDHCVFDQAILPAAGYLETAVAAAAGVFGTDGVVLENVAFQQALKLPEDAERIVQTVLKPDGADAFTFEIYSRSEDAPEQPWVRHAAGRLVRPDATPAAAPEDPALLAADAGETVDVDALYRQCRARGVGLGPRFQALKRAWRQDRAALGEIELPATLAPGVSDYHLHPVLLDAAFQAMGAVFVGHDGADVYLPVALDRLRVYRRGGAAGWSRLRVEPIQGARDQSLRVDLSLLSAEGHVVAVLEGLHLKRASREQLQGPSSEAYADWLYAVEWLVQNPEDPHAGPDYWPDAGEIDGTILPSLARDLAPPPESARYGAFFEGIEDAAVDYVVAAFRRLGWAFPLGQRISADALAGRFGVVGRQRRLFERLLGILAEVGILARRSDSEWEVASPGNRRDGAAAAERLFREYPDAAAELTLLRRCGERLADVLRGECDPLELLFPEGEAVTAANLYGDSPAARAANGMVQRLARTLLERLPEDRRVRILEIGAGTGGTTSHLLDELPAERTDYAFTDVSPLFLHRAAERFRAYPFLRFSVLDIEEPPTGQGFEPDGYDLVVAANVLHATRDLRRTLRHVRELLAPGGLLVLLEGTAPLRFIDLIFGLTEGWWRFADPDLRPAHPLLSAERWKSLLEGSGFRHAGAVASPREAGDVWSTQALIVAQALEPDNTMRLRLEPGEAKRWLILAPEESTLAEALRRQVEAAGDLATLAYPGRHYERTAAGDFRIDPASPADFRRLVDEAAAEWRAPLARIVHLWATAPTPETGLAAKDLETANVLGCGAALHLVQAALGAGQGAPPELWLATRGAQPAASGQDLPGLAGSPLWGFGKVANLEFPELRCVCVDLDGDDERAALCLYGEIRRGSAEDQVAFRGGRRYVARLVRHAGERRDFSVRPDGTYLITGGHRGLGLETAKWLVEQGARSLVLLGRGDAEADAETAGELAGLRRAGAVVEAVRADVADAGQVAGVIARIDAHLPPLRGIVHSAGVLDDGILAQQSLERFQRVLAPKMLGAWHLHALTKSHTLDFFVLYSSLASLLGSPGQANHSAANAFLDALAHHRRALGLPGLSINWGVWSEIGAAVRHRVGQRVKAQGMGTISPRQGMRILGTLLAQNGAQVGVAPIDWPVVARLSKAGRMPPFFANFTARRPVTEAGRPGRAVDLALELRAAPAAEREPRVEAHLRVQVAGVLRLAPDEVSVEQPLNRIGLDSLMAVELRNRLRSQLGLDVPLVKFMDDLSIRCLASELGAQLAEAVSAGPERREPEPKRPAPPVSLEAEPLLARLDQLSDDEVDALLAGELAEHADHVFDEGRP